jgi:hypothetical protein
VAVQFGTGGTAGRKRMHFARLYLLTKLIRIALLKLNRASSPVVSLQYTAVHYSTVQFTTAPMVDVWPYSFVPAAPLA